MASRALTPRLRIARSSSPISTDTRHTPETTSILTAISPRNDRSSISRMPAMREMLERSLRGDIAVRMDVVSGVCRVSVDIGELDLAILNLGVNARDAMPQGGTLTLRVHHVELRGSPDDLRGEFVALAVSDSGTGIAPELLPRVFEPFFTTKEVGKGTGLGLATVFGIVQQHKGWINVYSQVGRGTTFRIYLPRLARVSGQKFVAPTMEPARGGNETILLVEDEPSLRASVRNVMSRLGYHVLVASDGVGALEVWRQHRDEIHLLLNDMVMPGGINGNELSERLLKENPKLKVIYTSGYSAEVAGKDFPLEEDVNFLTKPFEAHKLAQDVRHCLDKI